jgi:hypothetical protein
MAVIHTQPNAPAPRNARARPGRTHANERSHHTRSGQAQKAGAAVGEWNSLQ